jgi:uncharacterized protein
MECSGRATLKGRTVLHVAAFNGQSLPAVLVECAIEEEPRVVLVANDPDDSTLGLPPGASVRIGFSVTGDEMTPLARVLPGDVT